MLKYHDDARDTTDHFDGGTYLNLKLMSSWYLNLRILPGGVRFKYDDDVLIQQNQVYKIWRS